MKLATAAYSMDFLPNWQTYEAKITRWVEEAVENGADLLVFPEYGAMELATLAGRETSLDLQASLRAVSDRMPQANTLFQHLATQHNVHILAPSGPVWDGEWASEGTPPVNRSHLFSPTSMGFQDKQIMTRFERETWHVQGGCPLKIFDTDLGRIGILICYDSEFPLLGRALEQIDILLVPSCTDALSGYWRVRIGAMARALENQCVAVMASTVGDCDWSPAVDENVGAGGVFGPPDLGFPATGVLAEGPLNAPGWTYAEIDLNTIHEVRKNGAVFNRKHWVEQDGRDLPAAFETLK
ncbi:MAG: carbon-nitrogen hydrolase family protein [Pelagimonas sp.]|jgi:predicted amidohydrolase|nr:carbon-nitrogen hydrolase family protein [Pelagimonas sp.]